jgi:hypothetical protein
MLAGDSVRHAKPVESTWALPFPPLLLGGLSMQWRLFTIATLASAAVAKRDHARRILSWIGGVLGIGQARVLAQVCNVYHLHLT